MEQIDPKLKNPYLLLQEFQDSSTVVELKLISTQLSNQRYQLPTLTKSCSNHPTICFEFAEAMNAINNQQTFRCPSKGCNGQAAQLSDLQKDVRWQAYSQFHELINDVVLIHGLMFNKLKYQKRIDDILKAQSFKEFLYDIYTRFDVQNSINMILKNQMQSGQYQRQKNQRIYYWAFCLQEKVKISIPVRIIKCVHLECYDLCSLLLFYKEQAKQENNEFQCRQPGCQNKLKMSNLAELFSGIVIDQDLLKVIKKGNPSIYKFYFNVQTMSLAEESLQINGRNSDFAISEFYKKVVKQPLDNKFFEFQDDVQKRVISILSKDSEKKDTISKYMTFQLNMKDSITGLIIEQPARCKFCPVNTKYIDLRSFISHFCYLKLTKPQEQYKCVLCGAILGNDKPTGTLLIQNFVQIEPNLLAQMFKDMSYIQTEIFQYEGNKYMLQEFQDRQKYSITEYKKNLIETNKSLEVNYQNLFCAYQKNQKLEFPLLLKKCIQRSIIDFSTFYKELERNKFDISQGIKFCDCSGCKELIKDINKNVYFHEGIYEMLQVLKKNRVTIEQNKLITFNFEKMIQVNTNQFARSDNVANQIMQGQEGFTSLLDDPDYQKIFERSDIGGYSFKIIQVEQVVCDGVITSHTQEGVNGNMALRIEQINQEAQQSDLGKKWKFEIKSMQVDFNNEFINTNIGSVQATQAAKTSQTFK